MVARFALARMRFIGAPWVRRADTPLIGIGGSVASPTGTMFAAVISTEDVALGYTSPPGVVERAGPQRRPPAGQRGPDQRAVAPRRGHRARRSASGPRRTSGFPSGAQNVLKYEQVLVWFRGKGDGWTSGDLSAFFKIGSDDQNWYMYLVPASSTVWIPEARISIPIWRQLRADIEQRWLQGLPPAGAAACGIGDPAAYVACDGPYVVQVADPGVNPPNLAAAQEMSAGIYRVANTETLTNVELWVDDIRLDAPLTQTGASMAHGRPPRGGRRGGLLGELRAAGRALPADRPRPDLPDHRGAGPRHQPAGGPLPPRVAGDRRARSR